MKMLVTNNFSFSLKFPQLSGLFITGRGRKPGPVSWGKCINTVENLLLDI